MKTVLILGATSGLARELARVYAASSERLILAAVDEDHLGDLAKDLRIRFSCQVDVCHFDALDTDSHAGFYEGLHVTPDITICVFGYMADQVEAEKDFALARLTMDINYTGTVSILEVVAADYEAKKRGGIICVSSVAGDRGRQSNYLYGSAKAGVTAYLSGLRNRLFRVGVHVMTVKPGFMNTAMTEGLDLPDMLTVEPEKAAKVILKAFQKKKNVVYILWMWRWIMMIIRAIPEFVFKRLKM